MPQTSRNTPSTSSTSVIPVVLGPKGLCFDISKVGDEGRRKRIVANRASAKSSRQRKLNDARALNDDLTWLDIENSALREINAALEQRIAEVHAAIERFSSFTTYENMTITSKIGAHSPSASNTIFPVIGTERP